MAVLFYIWACLTGILIVEIAITAIVFRYINLSPEVGVLLSLATIIFVLISATWVLLLPPCPLSLFIWLLLAWPAIHIGKLVGIKLHRKASKRLKRLGSGHDT
jgi:hypothetical protein